MNQTLGSCWCDLFLLLLMSSQCLQDSWAHWVLECQQALLGSSQEVGNGVKWFTSCREPVDNGHVSAACCGVQKKGNSQHNLCLHGGSFPRIFLSPWRPKNLQSSHQHPGPQAALSKLISPLSGSLEEHEFSHSGEVYIYFFFLVTSVCFWRAKATQTRCTAVLRHSVADELQWSFN